MFLKEDIKLIYAKINHIVYIFPISLLYGLIAYVSKLSLLWSIVLDEVQNK
jgi:hypothetical protein